MLVAGKTGCGKTNANPNEHQEKLVDLKRVMDEISEKRWLSSLGISRKHPCNK